MTLDKEEIFATNTIKVEMTRGSYFNLSDSIKEKFVSEILERPGNSKLIKHFSNDSAKLSS
ncbi:hypothetical protein ACMGE9_03705 [Macrococcus sp. EM39E]|uniref:hypothetical protein n=1 Tax=Macrococcus animalis TaxID=3395467 RepID=UPI0039BE9721